MKTSSLTYIYNYVKCWDLQRSRLTLAKAVVTVTYPVFTANTGTANQTILYIVTVNGSLLVFLSCYCHEAYRVEAVGLINYNYT